MTMNNKGELMSDIKRFNLVDEPWIPIVGFPLVSLRQLFTETGLELAGNPIEKIALLKLLLAIAQAAYTPKDDDDWRRLGMGGMAKRCLAYLDQWHHRFYLYGPEPFLQMPAIKNTNKTSLGVVIPQNGPDNNSVLYHSQIQRDISDAEKAVLIVTLMGFGLATGAKKGKKAAKPGTWLGEYGYLHNFLFGEDALSTIWFNMLTHEGIQCRDGVGVPPWEDMPMDRESTVARTLKESLIGKFVPLSRFCLLHDTDFYYLDGISHPTHKEGGRDPSLVLNFSKNPGALWVDPSKRPWRLLTSILGFFSHSGTDSWECIHLRQGLSRAKEFSDKISIWSGGLKVSKYGFGDHKVTGADNFVESKVDLQSEWLGEPWFIRLETQMERLEELSKELASSVCGYFKENKSENRLAKGQTRKALTLYWQFCEKEFSLLLEACNEIGSQARDQIWKRYIEHARSAFDCVCPRSTPRQLDAWSKYRPNLNRFINK